MIIASSLGSLVHPFYNAFAWLIAEFYNLIPNYAIAIALLTLTVMIIVFPITLKGTRGMMKMQLLAPEVKKLQARYKVTPGMSVEERQESRRRLNEEMMALYRENNASPTGGCLPMFLQFPIFLVLYGTIKGLTHRSTTGSGAAKVSHVDPLYISHSSKIYHDILAASGALKAFGINLADSVRTPGLSWAGKAPFLVLILVAIGLQYIQMKQMSGRNPAAAQANPQMQQMQKVFPILFAVIYISIPAGVNVYFIVSSLFRVAQQELMYRRDPHIQASVAQLRARSASSGKVVDANVVHVSSGDQVRKGLLGRLLPAPALEQSSPGRSHDVAASGSGNGSKSPPDRNGGAAARSGRPSNNGSRPAAESAKRVQPRAQGKRPRRPR